MSTIELAVDCRAVIKSYRNNGTITPALRGVELQVHAGELLMLVGPSGCGKTTLISVIAGILNQDQGVCRVFGVDINRLDEGAKTVYRGRTLGFVFQSFNLIPTINVRENVAVPLLIGGMKRQAAFDRADELLREVGLEDKLTALPKHLSGGQQQRVAIARALVHGPKLIVCDEPTSALDQETGRKVLQIFRDVALKDGRTLVVVTHDSRIFTYADRIAQMNDGVIASVQ